MKIPWFNKKDKQGFIPIEVKTTEQDGLVRFDPASPTWRFVEQWARKNLKHLRNDLEKDLSEKKTAEIRGRIAFCRKLLNVPDEIMSRETASQQNRQGILAGGSMNDEQ